MRGERFEHRLSFFTGKGGVGKSVLSAAVALSHARRGRRTLLVELTGTEQAPSLFGRHRPSGYAPTRLSEELPLFSCCITQKDALEEYGLMKLRVRMLYRMVFENDFVERLVQMVPGLHELLMIGKIWFLEQEQRDGRPLWDRIIVDAPATGHGVGLLQLPGVIVDAVSSGPLASDTRPIVDMLRDPTRTAVHLVSLPEELPVRETLELRERIRDDLGIPIRTCFVNKLWPEPLSEREQRLLRRFRAAVRGSDADLDGLLDRVKGALARQAFQRSHVRHLSDGLGDLRLVGIPYLFSDHIGPADLDVLSHYMSEAPRH